MDAPPVSLIKETMPEDKSTQMEVIAQAIRGLQGSSLLAFRQKNGYQPVIGEGSLDARILFIGEAPGEQEAKTGRPFVGASGRVLSEFLKGIGLERQDVYITNVVKDRPPENRDPSPEEIALYSPFLMRQIEIIQPKVIVTLGRFAMDYILEQFKMPEFGQKISALHGNLLETQASFGPLKVLPLFHPAVALYNRGQRAAMEADFQQLKSFVK